MKRLDSWACPVERSDMCVKTIVDASAFRHLGEETRNSAGHQLRSWIVQGNGLIVYSPDNTKYANELKESGHTLKLLRDYKKRGLAMEIGNAEVNEALTCIPERPTRRSNDPHVLALARASGATVLFSCDEKLRQDFADSAVLSNAGKRPRRSVPSLCVHRPADTNGAKTRRNFLSRRKCAR